MIAVVMVIVLANRVTIVEMNERKPPPVSTTIHVNFVLRALSLRFTYMINFKI